MLNDMTAFAESMRQDDSNDNKSSDQLSPFFKDSIDSFISNNSQDSDKEARVDYDAGHGDHIKILNVSLVD